MELKHQVITFFSIVVEPPYGFSAVRELFVFIVHKDTARQTLGEDVITILGWGDKVNLLASDLRFRSRGR